MATLTFLFTDIEGSTQLWETYPEAMKAALQKHDLLLQRACLVNDALFIKSTGDGMLAVFPSAVQAACMAVEAQRSLNGADWGETGPLRVRIGAHSGEAEQRQGDYFGQPVNRTARVMALAHGGQVLFSSAAAGLLQDNLPVGFHLVDLGEQRLKDLERPERIFQLTVEDLESDFPALRSLGAHPNNLPVQLTSFIGREKEIAQVRSMLAKSRLVTLTGPGGTGKTRLSLQAAAEVVDNFLDGVWLVELASLTDPNLVPLGIASVLDVREQSGRTLADAVIDFLRYKHCLLILDNCEHLVEACAQLAGKLLTACPKLTILASSRESLGVSGEMILRLPPLAVPDLPSQDSPLEFEQTCQLQEFEAVQLFVERAQAVSAGFQLDSANVRAVVKICKRLDGIPLALELAAARTRLLPVSQIAEKLDDRFRLLTGGSRTALPRQQTLQALIEWSWDLLEEAEKALLRRLAVFAGGISLAAVEAICALDPAETWALLDCLDDLVNKSLLIAGEGNGEARFSLLETIRQFARDRLRESGEGALVRDRHREYFTRFARDESSAINGSAMVRSLDNLESEYENLRLALDWGLENRWEGVLDLAGSLVPYWELRAMKSDGGFWLEAVLRFSKELPPPVESDLPRRQAQQALLLAGLASLKISQVEHAVTVEIAESACVLARQSGDMPVLVYALGVLALTSSFAGKIEQAKEAVVESVRITRKINDPYLYARSHLARPFLAGAIDGDFEKAAEMALKVVEVGQQTGNPFLIGMGYFQRGMWEMLNRDYESARQSLQAGIEMFASIKSNFLVTVLRSNLGHVERKAGNITQAACIYQQTLPRWLETGSLSSIAHHFESLAYLCLACDEAVLAAQLLGYAGVLREGSSDPRMPDEASEYQNALDQLLGSLPEADFYAATADGQALDMEAAIELAYQTIDRLIQGPCV